MHLSLVATGLIASAASAYASTQVVKNYCQIPFYLTFTDASQTTTGPDQLNPGEAFSNTITGSGNSLGVTRSPNYFSSSTPKLILGTSIGSDDNMYWSVNDVDGDPVAGMGFDVTSTGSKPDVCGHATTYGSTVHACPNDGVTLTLALC